MSRRPPPLITQAGQQLAAATSELAPGLPPETIDGPTCGRPVEYEVDTAFAAGTEADLNFRVIGPSRMEVSAEAQPSGKSHIVTFVPHDGGVYELHVTNDGVDIRGSPFTINVADDPSYLPPTGDPSKCVATGPGLRSCVEGQTAFFDVDTRQAGIGRLTVKMTGPCRAEITPSPPETLCNGDRVSSKFQYTVFGPGDYNLYVCWSERQIPGSPFKVCAT